MSEVPGERSPRRGEDAGPFLRFAAMAAIGVSAGVAMVALLVPRADPAPPPVVAPAEPVVRIGGEALDPKKGDPVAKALDLVRRYAQGDIALELPDGRRFPLKRSALGAEIDRAHVASLVRQALDPASPLRRVHDRERPGQPIDLPIPISINAELAAARLSDLKAEIDTPAADAWVDLAARKLQPEKIGYRLDVFATIARLDGAIRAGEATARAAVEKVTPKLLASALGVVKFDQVLGWFETRYTRGQRFADRAYNLHLAASRLDGTIVMPGEIFDFNAIVGPRDEAHGYRVAPVIAQGEVVDGIGGGTCQISGTLHGAVLFAGLEIVERSPHSRPSWYMPLGLDATVAYPNIDFRFRNPFDFPVVLHETVSEGVVRAEVLGPKRALTVTMFRRVDEVIPYEETERQSPRLPEGKRVLAQRGVPGFRATISRVVRDGAHGVREKWVDTYPPTHQVVLVGTGPKELESRLHGDQHPEYTAAEYLVLTQGPDVKGAPESPGMAENREPGRTGVRGWTEKLGMPMWREGADGDDEKDKKGDEKDKKKGDEKDKKKGDKKRPDDKKGDDKKKDPSGKKRDPKKDRK